MSVFRLALTGSFAALLYSLLAVAIEREKRRVVKCVRAELSEDLTSLDFFVCNGEVVSRRLDVLRFGGGGDVAQAHVIDERDLVHVQARAFGRGLHAIQRYATFALGSHLDLSAHRRLTPFAQYVPYLHRRLEASGATQSDARYQATLTERVAVGDQVLRYVRMGAGFARIDDGDSEADDNVFALYSIYGGDKTLLAQHARLKLSRLGAGAVSLASFSLAAAFMLLKSKSQQ